MTGRTAALAGVLLLTALAYAPSLGGELVWDDVILIRDNPAIAEGVFGDYFRRGAGQPASGYVRPVPALLNAATWAVAGAAPLPYRLTSLALHLLAVALLWGLAVRLGARAGPAALGAGVFALHPVQTEAVAFVSGRTDLLAAVFVLAALHAWLSARQGRRWGAPAAAAAFVLALASKEVALGALAVVAALEVTGAPGRRSRAALGALAAAAAVMVAARLAADVPLAGRMYFEAPALPAAMWELTALYARLLVWPADQRVLYDHLAPGWGAAAAVGAALWVAAVWVALRWRGRAAVCVVWAAAFLLPVLHVVPLPALAAERYLYLPSMALALGLAFALPRAPWAAAALLLLPAAATAARAAVWHDEVALWSAEAARGGSFKAPLNLGVALAERGRAAEAAAALREAWRLRPGHPATFRNRVRVLLMLPAGAGLGAEEVALRADVLAPNPNVAAVRRWIDPLRAAGYEELADLLAEVTSAP